MSSQEPNLGDYVDELFELSLETYGKPLTTLLCDRNVLLPLDELPGHVKSETGEELATERLTALVPAGWIPDLKVAGARAPGFAMYAPARVGLFLELEREGYSPDELRALAEYEEGFITDILVNEEMPYLDDDRELLLASWRADIEANERLLGWRWDDGGLSTQEQARLHDEIESLGRQISFLEAHPLQTMSEDLRKKTAKMAWRTRARDEFVRLTQLTRVRDLIRMGYTPWLIFLGVQHFGGDEPPVTGPPNWEHSLSQPGAWEPGVVIRVPGVKLVGGEIVSQLNPTEYERRWKESDLGGYLRERARILGERACLHCHRKLPGDAAPDRLYCSDTCRNNAKVQRFRDAQRAAAAQRARSLA